MKKNLLSLTTLSVLAVTTTLGTAQASLFDSIDDQIFQASALEALRGNAQEVRLEGDVRPGERLDELLVKIDSYTQELEETLARGDSPENMQSSISNVTNSCERIASLQSAKCTLLISFKPIGETALIYQAQLDSEGKVLGIQPRVYVSRGD